MIETTAALAAVKEIDGALGILQKAAAKFKSQPDAAALKLAEALDEIAKTWQVMDQAIMQVIALGYDDAALAKGSMTLLAIEGGALVVNVEQGRGHCHVIGNIFGQYLDRWFQRIFKGDELEQVRSVFRDLGSADADVFSHMIDVARQLQGEANVALDSLARGDMPAAKTRLLALRPALTPLRLSITGSMATLHSLKGEFIQIATLV